MKPRRGAFPSESDSDFPRRCFRCWWERRTWMWSSASPPQRKGSWAAAVAVLDARHRVLLRPEGHSASATQHTDAQRHRRPRTAAEPSPLLADAAPVKGIASEAKAAASVAGVAVGWRAQRVRGHTACSTAEWRKERREGEAVTRQKGGPVQLDLERGSSAAAENTLLSLLVRWRAPERSALRSQED